MAAMATTAIDTDSNNARMEQLNEKVRQLEEEKRKLEEELRKRAEAEDELQEHKRLRRKHSLLTYLLDPEEKQNNSGMEPEVSTGHVMATRTHEFTSSLLLRDFAFDLNHDAGLVFTGNTRRIHSKREVEINACNLLESLLDAMGLDSLYQVQLHFVEAEPACDIVLIQTLGLVPIGFVKVMLPATGGDDTEVFGGFQGDKMTEPGNGYVAGQMFDLLVGLQSIGPKNPVALLTNGNKWQLVTIKKTLPGEFPERQDAELRKPVKRLKPSGSRPRLSRFADKGIGKITKIAKPVVDLMDKWKKGSREVFVSDSVNVIDGEANNGMKLGQFLAKAIRLMINSSKNRSDSQHQGTPIQLVDCKSGAGDSSYEVALVHKLPWNDESKYPSNEVSRFYLVEYLLTRQGKTYYKALADDGSTCAIKVFYGYDGIKWDEEAYNAVLACAQEECHTWNEIYGPGQCRVCELGSGGEIHLIAPFLRFVERDEQISGQVIDRVIASCNLDETSDIILATAFKPLSVGNKQGEQQIDACDETLPPSPEGN
jgi:hypothetical protein